MKYDDTKLLLLAVWLCIRYRRTFNNALYPSEENGNTRGGDGQRRDDGKSERGNKPQKFSLDVDMIIPQNDRPGGVLYSSDMLLISPSSFIFSFAPPRILTHSLKGNYSFFTCSTPPDSFDDPPAFTIPQFRLANQQHSSTFPP